MIKFIRLWIESRKLDHELYEMVERNNRIARQKALWG